ncbi:MAG: thiolase family protein [Planctomycetes bacterium]|nr:thiolase family protein [Planctomycetota bacterium]
MRFTKTFIPYGAYWSTPFCKWQGSFSTLNAVPFAAQVAKQALAERKIAPEVFRSVVLGITVPQKHSFYGAPWLAGMVGAAGISGPIVAQACATGARVLATAAAEVETTGDHIALTVTADRCSNGPHIYYPNPAGPGGTGDKEDWVMDNFGLDPWARNPMIETAENVAKQQKISREEQDALTLVRFGQYQQALANDAAFLKRFMPWPLAAMDASGKKTIATVAGDEGVFPTTKDGLAKLRPVQPEGTVTFGSQTHPADGNSGMVVCDRTRARELARERGLEVQLLSFAQARVDKGFMAKATVPAARAALQDAGLAGVRLDAIKTHNPFAVNDIYFAREMGIVLESFNNYGSSLIYGHPQGPTGTRLIIELIEELAQKGGGHGLFVGCAAGDSAAAIVLKVGA